MPALARRRKLDAADECWHVFHGDVRIGATALRTGMPHREDPWAGPAGPAPVAAAADASSSHSRFLCRLSNACSVSSMKHTF
jgi:hypothetical protein